MLKKTIHLLTGLIVLSVCAFFLTRIILYKQFEKQGLVALKSGADNPFPSDIIHRDLDVALKGRTLKARWVPAGIEAPSIFILHGNGENLGDWIKVQEYLKRKGFSTFVFDYTGFGNSTGVPTIEGLDADALEMYKYYLSLSKRSNRQIIFTHSLGGCVYLDISEKFQSFPHIVVLNAAISSARDYLVNNGVIDSSIEWLVPDIWNNVENLKQCRDRHLFLTQGGCDKIVNEGMRKKIKKAIPPQAKVLLIPFLKHNSILDAPNDSVWNPIIKIFQSSQ
ncbi:hypothetical protein FHW88_004303 [Mucilaginibacter sp. SG538B]|uniref:alpha/beta hydrolase n=1 Tax=Mucilaginibacter sp. SG538B TaxID=2587021 RepID=UPI00159DDC37|nr:alpha/beta fold hydrolase [Mucilaginibacter sp. SG538B]NVM65999.1 hypothetical protein [Mucilaginibacter sp. SG538B]